MDELLIFGTCYRENSEYNNADAAREMQQLLQRQQVIQNTLLKGEDFDDLFDLLEEQGIDSAEYVDMVESNVDFVICNDLIVPHTIFYYEPTNS
ncbi:hypothetical protein DSM106972_015900 [Dulcicalothrix desertica PCC 7102]|uniref:Uncharacterized protein n=1 Tax=Dulcicalothrix desertica PCC 7102 TaxID=232991 RepID=A0A3S1CTL8_9CYAN|nr:hypothetical protein [Dulcicalothrix desertica]RUT08422.1 hypothetical protein DSM106972_015900 [Dulcicalothrix desertica PCC 7102]TWH40287.1 hypothetical protein CAL7102_09594 [Dulcicalothrix desertica PCC 7102]